MNEILIKYAPAAMLAVFSALSWLLAKYVANKIENEKHEAILFRAFDEIKASVLEVGYTYVDALKEANKDGVLTGPEKEIAKDRAFAIAKTNIGKKGLKKLAKIVDAEDWIANKIEVLVGERAHSIKKQEARY